MFLGTATGWALVLMFAPGLDSADPEIFLRMLVNKFLTLTLFTVLGTGCLLWIDKVTPGDWLEKIHENPMACAVVFGVILYCLCWSFTWA
jgi:hypothetical protein